MAFKMGRYLVYDDTDEPAIRAWWDNLTPEQRRHSMLEGEPLHLEYDWEGFDTPYDRLSTWAEADVWQLYANLHQQE